jgi:hypothetical protein
VRTSAVGKINSTIHTYSACFIHVVSSYTRIVYSPSNLFSNHVLRIKSSFGLEIAFFRVIKMLHFVNSS